MLVDDGEGGDGDGEESGGLGVVYKRKGSSWCLWVVVDGGYERLRGRVGVGLCIGGRGRHGGRGSWWSGVKGVALNHIGCCGRMAVWGVRVVAGRGGQGPRSCAV